jgi:CheY-like chemotaxis protein
MNPANTPKKRILVVEDDSDFAALIESVLNGQGYDVTVVYNCEEGLKKFRENPPDLVTLDLQMPKGQRKSGLHFYRSVKSQDAYKHLPIVVITGVMRDDPDMRNLVKAFLEIDRVEPPTAYIHKPFDNAELIRVVASALGETS